MPATPGILPEPRIRAAGVEDADAIASIYNVYVETSVATFDMRPVSAGDVASRVLEVTKAHPWLVAEIDERVAAYAYAMRWKPREAYRYTVETTIYVADGFTGSGIGRTLYRALLDELAERGFRNAIGGIALPNAASVALHEHLGFREVGRFQKVGYKLGRAVDVGYWQKVL